MKNSLLWALMLFMPYPALAGQIILSNGDRLSGELQRIEDGKLYWQADSIGEVGIEAGLVQSINTNTEVSSEELAGPCLINGVENGDLYFRCESGATGSIALNVVRKVETYQDPDLVPVDYRGKLLVSGRHSSGNTEEKSYSVDSETLYRRGDRRHQTKIDYDSLNSESDTAGDKLVLRYGYDWFFRQRWYWYNNLRGGFDEPADIESRYRYGTGLGFQVWDHQDSALSLESGLSFVRESVEDPATPDPDFEKTRRFAAWQWTLNYRHLLLGKAEFFHKHQLINSLEDSNDWNLETETGISAPFIGKLRGEIKVDYDVDNSPAEDKQREDTLINVGLGYNW